MTATALFCFGTSISMLVLGRVLQGAATAMNQTLPRAMLVHRAGTENAGVYMGYLTFVSCMANIASFFLGGLIYQRVGYRPVWFLCFAMISTEIVTWLAILDPRQEHESETGTDVEDQRGQDEPKQDVMALATAPALLPVVDTASDHSLDQEKELTLDVISPATAPALVPVVYTASDLSLDQEKKSTTIAVTELQVHSTLDTIEHGNAGNPITTPGHMAKPLRRQLPTFIRLLMSPRILTTIFGTLIAQCTVIAFDAVLPQHVNLVFSWNSFPAGLIMTTLYLAGFVNPWVGKFCDRRGPKHVATAGLCLATPCLIALRAVNGDSTGKKVLLAFLLVIIGLAACLTVVGCGAEVAYAVKAMQVDSVDTTASTTPASSSSSSPSTSTESAVANSGKQGEHMLARAYSLNAMAEAAACTVGPLWAGLVSNAQGWNAMTLSLGIVAAVMAIPTWFVISGETENDDATDG